MRYSKLQGLIEFGISFFVLFFIHFVDRLSFFAFEIWVCFVANKQIDKLLIALWYCDAQSWASNDVFEVDSAEGFEQVASHGLVIALHCPNQASLVELVILEDQFWVLLDQLSNFYQFTKLHLQEEVLYLVKVELPIVFREVRVPLSSLNWDVFSHFMRM